MQTGIHIGTIVEKETMETVTTQLIRLMETKADQDTIQRAMDVFAKMSTVSNVAVHNCSVIGDRKVTVDINSDTGDVEVDRAGP